MTCDIAEAYLVEIDSDSENKFVKTMANNNRGRFINIFLSERERERVRERERERERVLGRGNKRVLD